MTTIQNVACIQATINPSDKRISLNKDILRGKKILSIYIFSSTEDNVINSPYRDEAITQVPEFDSVSLFLNLQDASGISFIKDLSFKNLMIDTESSYSQKYINYNINRVLDLDQSYISYKGSVSDPINILIYVFYQTENFSRINDEINGLVTFKMPVVSAKQDIKLSDIVNFTLKGKKIKQMIISSDIYDSPIPGYLDLFMVKNRIENLPACLLQYHSPKDFYFDNLDIDFEKSFFRNRTTSSIIIPFNITFIY